MDFSTQSLPQRVAAHELTLRALQDEVHALRALVVSMIDVVAAAKSSTEYEASLAALIAERNRI